MDHIDPNTITFTTGFAFQGVIYPTLQAAEAAERHHRFLIDSNNARQELFNFLINRTHLAVSDINDLCESIQVNAVDLLPIIKRLVPPNYQAKNNTKADGENFYTKED